MVCVCLKCIFSGVVWSSVLVGDDGAGFFFLFSFCGFLHGPLFLASLFPIPDYSSMSMNAWMALGERVSIGKMFMGIPLVVFCGFWGFCFAFSWP